MSGAAELRRRVAQLDEGLGDPLVQFIEVISRITDSGAEPDTISAAEADSVIAGCRLLRHLEDIAPEIVSGPLAPDRQFWIATGKPAHRPPGDPVPSAAAFKPVTPDTAGTKPFEVGLFTSTGVLGRPGMWRVYLDLNRGSTLHPTPWHTWLLTPGDDLAVREITTAGQWVDFVLAYGRRSGRRIAPDWVRVAADYDAVHLTTRAIAAVQGLSFPTADGLLAPTYWDVESTLWLRWRFTATRPAGVTDQP